MHTITSEELMEAMEHVIPIASSTNSETRKTKSLIFNPIDLRYNLVYCVEGKTEVYDYLHPQDAIAKYNGLTT